MVIIILLILLILLIYIVRSYHNKERVDTSNGTFDSAAKADYKLVDMAIKKSGRGHFKRARLAANNIVRGGHTYAPEIRDQINEDFRIALFDNDPEYTPEFIADQAIQWWILTGNRAPPEHARAVTQIRQTRITDAISNAKNKQEVSAAYLNNVNITSDAQNVHDSSVNNDLRRMLAVIDAENNDSSVVIEPTKYKREIQDYIQALPPHKRTAATATLQAMLAGQTVGTFNKSEPEILYTVWSRSHHPVNVESASNIREAIVEALYDASSNGTVCVNGRCGRVIEALAAIDSDRRLDGAKTTEAYKAEIFEKTRTLIDNYVSSIANDPSMSEMHKSYTDPSIVVPAAQIERFNNEVSSKIDTMCNTYADRVNVAQLAIITADAKAAI